jgi:acylpyruvate hydrolase
MSKLPGKVVAVAKNYAKHALEMGGSGVKQTRASFFLKPQSSVIFPGASILRPSACTDLHHEVELGVYISRRCTRAQAQDWRSYVSGYCLALDMTARDLQAQEKKEGAPWTRGKCFDTFSPLGPFIPAADFPEDPHSVELWLKVDGVQRQRGSALDMMTRIPELLEQISAVMTLEEGDIILTGTPEGVGPVAPGQVITAGITGLSEVTFPVAQREY